MPASAWDKFLLLTWKNWLIQLRHPVQTIFEIVIPVVVIALVVVIRGLVSISETTNDIRYPALNVSEIGSVLSIKDLQFRLAYSPDVPLLENIFNGVKEELGFLSVNRFGNSTLLEENALNNLPFASFEFDDSLIVSLHSFCLQLDVQTFSCSRAQQRFPMSLTTQLDFPLN